MTTLFLNACMTLLCCALVIVSEDKRLWGAFGYQGSEGSHVVRRRYSFKGCVKVTVEHIQWAGVCVRICMFPVHVQFLPSRYTSTSSRISSDFSSSLPNPTPMLLPSTNTIKTARPSLRPSHSTITPPSIGYSNENMGRTPTPNTR